MNESNQNLQMPNNLDVNKGKGKIILFIILPIIIIFIALSGTNPNKEGCITWLRNQIIAKSNNPIVSVLLSLPKIKLEDQISEFKDYIIFTTFQSTDIQGNKYFTLGIANNFFILNEQTNKSLTASQLWDFNLIKEFLPQEDAVYEEKSGENKNYIEYSYDAGALRLYISPYTKKVLGILIDSSKPSYSKFQTQKSTAEFSCFHVTNLTFICYSEPVNSDTFNMLKQNSITLELLKKLLGDPSYQSHIHGVGATIYTYFPQGLSFITGAYGEINLYPLYLNKSLPDINDNEAMYYFNQGLTYDDYKVMLNNMFSSFASDQVKYLAKISALLENGKKSPDASYTAAILENGGYWDNWILINREGKSELRERASYFISEFEWLDNQRLLYEDTMGSFTIVDVELGVQKEIYKLDEYSNDTKFEITQDKKVKYTDSSGKWQEFKIPDYF